MVKGKSVCSSSQFAIVFFSLGIIGKNSAIPQRFRYFATWLPKYIYRLRSNPWVLLKCLQLFMIIGRVSTT